MGWDNFRAPLGPLVSYTGFNAWDVRFVSVINEDGINMMSRLPWVEPDSSWLMLNAHGHDIRLCRVYFGEEVLTVDVGRSLSSFLDTRDNDIQHLQARRWGLMLEKVAFGVACPTRVDLTV